MPQHKYNVVIFMTDQHRADCLSCAGNPTIQTHFIDGIASEGVQFTSAYSAVPSCIPARGIMMTGQKPWHLGILGMGEGQPEMRSDYPHTLASELSNAGYHTQLVGKMHFHPPRALNGFHATILDEHADDMDYEKYFERHGPKGVHMREHLRDWNSMVSRPFPFEEHLHPTNWTAREGVEFLKRRDPTKPFFLVNSYIRPHSPYDPPAFYWDLYKDKDIPQPFEGDWSTMHDCTSSNRDRMQLSPWRGKKSPAETKQARTGYYASVTHVDHQIGNVIAELKDQGVYDETLIVFTSDHGDMLGDHHLWRKTYAYEGSARIPFIIKFPKSMQVQEGSICQKVVELRDIMPTILECCGLPIPPTVDGKNVMRAINNETWRDYLHGEHSTCYSSDEEMHYLTDGKTKYIWFPRTGKEMFFDLENDPEERQELSSAPSHQTTIERWREILTKELSDRPGFVKGGLLQIQHQATVSPYAHRPRQDVDVTSLSESS